MGLYCVARKIIGNSIILRKADMDYVLKGSVAVSNECEESRPYKLNRSEYA